MSTIAKGLHRIAHASLAARVLILFFLGALTSFAMPPTSFWPGLWVSFPLFIVVLQSAKNWKQTFTLGWAFGFGFFAIGFAWIGNAFFVDRETYAALAVPAIGGLAAGFAIYIGLVALTLRVLRQPADDSMPRDQTVNVICSIIFMAAVWAIVEWWRGWFLTGLPWNPIGSAWSGAVPVMQSASLFGVFGLSLITVLAAASPALLTRGGDRRLALTAVALCHIPLMASAIWGVLRLTSASEGYVQDIMFRLVQPNIAQADKWRPGLREQHLTQQVALSLEGAGNVTHVLWAETAAPYALNRASQALALAAMAVPENGFLLTGAPRVTNDGGERTAFNSLFAVTPQATIAATYDKTHLVPFGEYMPLRDIIPWTHLTGGSGFSAGPGIQTMRLAGMPSFSPLICYEIIFPGRVAAPDDRPEWLFNLTNDAWFGISNGPYQHLASAQMRAVEEGLAVVRVANTGISAVIDPYGRIIKKVSLGQAGFADSQLPRALEPTVFSAFGHVPVLVIAMAMAGLATAAARRTID